MIKRPRPRKRLGQHWLVDQAAVSDIVAAAGLTGRETVVEVGPGPGVLTPVLCEQAKHVIAIELDGAVLLKLRQATNKYRNLTIRQADILSVPTTTLPQPYVVVANVPYYITSAILKHFLESANRPVAMTLTIQAEVAERIVAKPPKMSMLAVSVQLYGRPRIRRRISRRAFRPVPKVDSAVLRIDDIGVGLNRRLGNLTEKQFFRMVRAGFSEKRKQLRNSLAGGLRLSSTAAAELLQAAGIEPARRAETLTVADWARLARVYEGH